MFLVSTRCGIIACRLLAEAFGSGTYLNAQAIAAHYNMNVRSLMPALRQLTRSGILQSRVGGKQPGFIFARDPSEISLLDVVTALEGSVSVPCCREVIKDLNCDCGNSGECAVYRLFDGLLTYSKRKLASVSVAEFARTGNGLFARTGLGLEFK
ncbi:RrF2 family transcriptional regulator [Coprobacter tertius]|uniref:Rrf2 family transcriptional regulator n=1 Tax=Coprobacter tertius TaxID=2944915 RepID=A0ABT1MJF9_9BACT|nr:Rrf2 family transcriptional regulator [Coprobacter tertius]MCP9611376.1 Rrf2 family transcriptional regulator [Coprobacter tertius]